MTITRHDKYFSDENGNRSFFDYFGGEEEARKALESLILCRNCINCSNCSECYGCSRCSDCSGCSHCYDCSGCSDCSCCYECYDCSECSHCRDCSGCGNCYKIKEAKNPKVVGPFRSDGYQFVMNWDGGIRAGCRVFDTIAMARTHWERTRGGTKLGDETMRILDFLENELKMREAE